MGWKKGDLGRFSSEDSKRPRFELIGISKDKKRLGVWYGGETKIRTIPIETFRKQCVNWWETRVIRDPLPPWLQPGEQFQLPKSHRHLTQARTVPHRRHEPFLQTSVEATGLLEIRSVRHNYMSCLTEGAEGMQGTRVLVLIELGVVIEHGFRHKTVWDRLGEDPFGPQEEEDLLEGVEFD